MWILLSCAAPVDDSGAPRGGVASSGDEEQAGTEPAGDTGSPSSEDSGAGAAVDDAAIVAADFPAELSCGEGAEASLTVENTGTTTWRREALYKLGTVDDEDPFHGDSTREYLDEGVVVAPGEEHTFAIDLSAPESEGSYTSDWQMVLEKVHWFGEVHEATIEVACDEPPPLDLDEVTWLHTSVADWKVTTSISEVTVDEEEICFPYDAADTWPALAVDGVEIVGNPWVFIWYDEQWYAGTWEWLRPGQTCKASSSVAGDHIKQEPFGKDSGWVPTSGDTYYLMVSGLVRDSNRNVEERSEPIAFTWP